MAAHIKNWPEITVVQCVFLTVLSFQMLCDMKLSLNLLP